MKTRYRLNENNGDVLFEGKYKVENKYKWLLIRVVETNELLFKMFPFRDLHVK